MHTFFGGDLNSQFYPYNHISDLKNFSFDVIIADPKKLSGIDVGKSFVINLHEFIISTKQALINIKNRNFQSCLNVNKIGVIAALAYLCPDQGKMLEVGAYQCGTTIFLAEFFKVLRKKVQIFACDTFEGMPVAGHHDKKDSIYYDSGLFTDNPIEAVRARIRKQGLDDQITLIQGDAVVTVPQLCQDGHKFFLMFLDTDQYKGTKSGLDAVLQCETTDILIDDTTLSSVSLAIDEFIGKNQKFKRKNIIKNFDYVFSTT